ncbi:hypothetical protein CAter10_0425 [Collimonas arenae]|nr:hypothetical protein CAter10_0425 [Collimonas arenae]
MRLDGFNYMLKAAVYIAAEENSSHKLSPSNNYRRTRVVTKEQTVSTTYI